MTEKRLMQEFTALMAEWTKAESVRQRLVDRLMKLDAPLTLDDPIWEEWGEADEVAGSAREEVRSFLAANGHTWRP